MQCVHICEIYYHAMLLCNKPLKHPVIHFNLAHIHQSFIAIPSLSSPQTLTTSLPPSSSMKSTLLESTYNEIMI